MQDAMKRMSLLFAITIFSCMPNTQQHNASHEYTWPTDTLVLKKLHQWQDIKFGLLMHWGTYSEWGIVESWSICPEDLGWATGARKPGVADNYFDYVKKY